MFLMHRPFSLSRKYIRAQTKLELSIVFEIKIGVGPASLPSILVLLTAKLVNFEKLR